MAKKTVDRRARPMAVKVASLTGTPLLALGRAVAASALEGESKTAEAGGGLMGAAEIPVRAWGFTRSVEPARVTGTAESCVN
jgi:hypothetical protein